MSSVRNGPARRARKRGTTAGNSGNGKKRNGSGKNSKCTCGGSGGSPAPTSLSPPSSTAVGFWQKLANASDEWITKHPGRSALGLYTGGALYSFAEMFNPLVQPYLDLTKPGPLGWVAVGLLLARIVSERRPPRPPESPVGKAAYEALILIASASDLSEAERRTLIRGHLELAFAEIVNFYVADAKQRQG